MKKLIVLMLVLGLANAASAVIYYEPHVDGSNADFLCHIDVAPIDIYATGNADYLLGTGELLITISGPAEFAANAFDNLTYAPSQEFWHPDYGLSVNAVIDDPQNARISVASLSTEDTFLLAMPDYPISNILVTFFGGGVSTITIIPNNSPNPWGNTNYKLDGVAYTDLEATGGSISEIPEPATIALLGLGGLALLRRRGRCNSKCERRPL